MASFTVEMLKSHLPHTTDQKHNEDTYLGASTPITREQTLTLTGQGQPQSKGEAPLNIQGRLLSPQYQSNPLSRG